MIPLIIESSSKEQIETYLADKYLSQNAVGELKPEGGVITLESIKFLIDRAKFSSSQKSAVFIIYDGHAITLPGQNALLKTLEESRPEQQFVITTTNRYFLLPTIVSRCQVVTLADNGNPSAQTNLKQFTNSLSDLAGCLSETDAKVGEATQYLTSLIRELRETNRELPTTKRFVILDLALTCLADLKGNLNPRLALDHFLLASRKAIQ